MISCSIIKLIESAFQIIAGLLLETNSLYLLRIILRIGRTHFKWLSIIIYVERDQIKYKNLSRNMLKLKVVDLTFSYSLSHFYFYFLFYFPFSIFRTKVRVRVTRSCYHTISHSNGYKS